MHYPDLDRARQQYGIFCSLFLRGNQWGIAKCQLFSQAKFILDFDSLAEGFEGV